MNLEQYLEQVRDKYVDYYRKVLRQRRDEGVECSPEIWIQPNTKPGERGPADPLCADVIIQEPGKDQPSLVMVMNGPINGPMVLDTQIRNVPIRVFESSWETFPVWARINDPDWSKLDSWKQKWLRSDSTGDNDHDGLHDIVHYIGRPTTEGGGYLYSMDFGSASAHALTELIDALIDLGATEIELGHPDGSQLPEDIKAELKQPQIPLEKHAAMVMRLLKEFPEVAGWSW